MTVSKSSGPEEGAVSLLRRWLTGNRQRLTSSKSRGSSQFVDQCLVACENTNGVAAGALLTPPVSVDAWKDAKDVYCCDGGASYLKVVYEAGSGESGLLTFDADIAAKNSTCDVIYDQTSSIGKKSGGESTSSLDYDLRFVPCDDTCVKGPSNAVPCSDSFDVMAVEHGTEVCFAAVDPLTHKIRFDQKMGTDVYIYFVPFGDEDPGALIGTIHASCSMPLVSPYAASLYDPCGPFDEENQLLNTELYNGNIPFLAFLDGISTGYYEAAMGSVGDGGDDGSYQQEFDITFGNCGCTCESFQHPPGTEGGSFPSSSPTGAPTIDSTVAPQAAPYSGVGGSPGPGFVPPGKCPSSCTKFIEENCVFGDNAGSELFGTKCDINARIQDDSGTSAEGDDGRRLQKIEYHHARIEAISKILAQLQ